MSGIFFNDTMIITDIVEKVNRHPYFFKGRKEKSTFFMDSRYRILERLASLHKTSRAVIRELENWGIKTTPSQFSDAVKGIIRYQKADDICETADKIITKWESERT